MKKVAGPTPNALWSNGKDRCIPLWRPRPRVSAFCTRQLCNESVHVKTA